MPPTRRPALSSSKTRNTYLGFVLGDGRAIR
jgi:hypothetical protein